MAATAIPVGTIPSINPATGESPRLFRENSADPSMPEIVARARATQVAMVEDFRLPIEPRASEFFANASSPRATPWPTRSFANPASPASKRYSPIFSSRSTPPNISPTTPNACCSPKSVPHHNLAAKAKSGTLTYEPLGVIGIISSWNYPLAIPISQIIPAIVAGNAVVCKTSDFTPHCGALIERLFAERRFSRRIW